MALHGRQLVVCSTRTATEKARRPRVFEWSAESHSLLWLTIEDLFSNESNCRE